MKLFREAFFFHLTLYNDSEDGIQTNTGYACAASQTIYSLVKKL